MEELLVIGNPKRRRRKHAKARRKGRRRTMTPLQRMYFGGKRRARRNPVGIAANPSRRHRRRKAKAGGIARRARRALGRSYSLQGLMRSPIATLQPAFTGALGAIAVNTLLQRLPLPGVLVVGRVRYVTQAVAAIGIAALAQRFAGLGGSTAAKMAEGALTVTMVDAIRDVAGQLGVPLGGMGYYLPGYSAGPAPMGLSRPSPQLGKYVSGPGASVVPMRRSLGGVNRISSGFKF